MIQARVHSIFRRWPTISINMQHDLCRQTVSKLPNPVVSAAWIGTCTSLFKHCNIRTRSQRSWSKVSRNSFISAHLSTRHILPHDKFICVEQEVACNISSYLTHLTFSEGSTCSLTFGHLADYETLKPKKSCEISQEIFIFVY